MAGSTITQDQIDRLVNVIQQAGLLQNVFQRKLSGNAITLNDGTCPTGTKACEDIDCLEQNIGLDPPVYTVSGAACVPTSYMDMRPKEQSMAIEQLMENLLTHSSSIMSTLRQQIDSKSCLSISGLGLDTTNIIKLCGMKNNCSYSKIDNRCYDSDLMDAVEASANTLSPMIKPIYDQNKQAFATELKTLFPTTSSYFSNEDRNSYNILIQSVYINMVLNNRITDQMTVDEIALRVVQSIVNGLNIANRRRQLVDAIKQYPTYQHLIAPFI